MRGIDEDLPTMTIGVAARLAGLSERRIRYYQKAGLLPTRRSRGNRRLFTVRDVERLRQLKDMVERGYTLRAIASELGTGQAGEQEGPSEAATGQGTGPAPAVTQPVNPEVMTQRLAGRGAISSLYPVRDQALLVGMLTATASRAKPQPAAGKKSGGKSHGVSHKE